MTDETSVPVRPRTIPELLDVIIEVFWTHRRAQEDRARFASMPPPVRPRQVERLGDWQAYVRARDAHTTKKNELELGVTQDAVRLRELQRVFTKHLPSGVWFRHGDVGIGIAHTNWGGSSSYFLVEPWQDEMPSLDHNYRGD